MQRNVTVVETKADSCLRGISIQFPRAGAKSQAGLGSCDTNGTVPSPHKELGVSRAGTTEEEPQGKDNIRSVSVPCSLLAEPLSLVAQDAQATTAPSMRWGEQVSAAQQLELPAEVCWGWGQLWALCCSCCLGCSACEISCQDEPLCAQHKSSVFCHLKENSLPWAMPVILDITHFWGLVSLFADRRLGSTTCPLETMLCWHNSVDLQSA